MKRKLLSVCVVLFFTLALTPMSPAFEEHPEIRAAIRALQNAQDHLEHAAHDFGGHRVDAMRAIGEATRQLQICEQYDRR